MNMHATLQKKASMLAAISLPISGICFTLFPIIRPFFNETSAQHAGGYVSPAWTISHSFGMAGFILLTLGMFGIYLRLLETKVEPLMWRVLLLVFVGTGCTLPFFGAEALSLPVIGKAALHHNSQELLGLINLVRFGPGISFVVIGLLLLAIAMIIFARVIWVSNIMPKWSGILLAIGFAIYMPILQGNSVFQPLRIIDGLIITVGCIGIAKALVQKST